MTLARARILKGAGGSPSGSSARTAPLARRIPREVVDARAEAARIVAEAEQRVARAVEHARVDAVARIAAEAIVERRADEQRAERDLERTTRIAVLLAERLVGETLAVAPARIAELAAAALRETRGARQIRIDACPDDVDALRAMLAAVGHAAEVHADATLGRGSLVVHTDLGAVDGRLRPQLERLAALLRGAT